MLTRKDHPFIFGPKQLAAQEDLKQALLSSPALRPIDYSSEAPVILAVDTSHIAIGFYLCQCDPNEPSRRFYARFSSITLNDRECSFSQAKLELYGLFRALRALKIYLIGVRNLVVEVDARYIKGMLANPDLDPSATINRWIMGILLFHFVLVHVPGTMHGPDGMSRRKPQPSDKPEPDNDFDDWIDEMYGFLHIINFDTKRATARDRMAVLTSDVAETVNPEESNSSIAYEDVPQTASAKEADMRLEYVSDWLTDLTRPADLSDAEYATFMRYAMRFFVKSNRLW